jgi:protein KRI1
LHLTCHRDASTISRYPRSIPTAARLPDTSRIDARKARNERKEAEKLQRKEEVKRLKALKMKEAREKLEMIGKEGGIELGDEGLFSKNDTINENSE